jgi:hypothetical protein
MTAPGAHDQLLGATRALGEAVITQGQVQREPVQDLALGPVFGNQQRRPLERSRVFRRRDNDFVAPGIVSRREDLCESREGLNGGPAPAAMAVPVTLLNAEGKVF